MKPMVRLLTQSAAALLLLASVFELSSQSRQSGSTPRSGIDRILTERNRVINNRRIEEGLRKPAERKEPQLAIEQIKEDYVRIQVVNTDLMRAALSREALDLKFVATSAAEIKKRAERLKHNLALPEPENADARPFVPTGDDEERVKASVLALGKLVTGFVRNPIFREVGVLDAQSAIRARRDLEEIIGLSSRVKRDSEQLSKEAHKTH